MTLSKNECAILTYQYQSHRIDEFQLNEAAIKHSRSLRPSELNSATAFEFLNSTHAVSTWAKSDAIVVLKLITE